MVLQLAASASLIAGPVSKPHSLKSSLFILTKSQPVISRSHKILKCLSFKCKTRFFKNPIRSPVFLFLISSDSTGEDCDFNINSGDVFISSLSDGRYNFAMKAHGNNY